MPKWLIATLVGLAVLCVGMFFMIPAVFPELQERAKITKSKDNLGGLLKYYLANDTGVEGRWPRLDGKAFILWLVATNRIDRRDPRQLEILFSPADPQRSLERAGGARAYDAITMESLRAGLIDLSKLTSYVGRRLVEGAQLPIPHAIVQRGVPVLADLSFPDLALVGFASGQVIELSRAELGLGPNDPLLAGDASKSPILRLLSDR